MKVYANPEKSLFKRENLFTRMYYSIRSWIKYTFDKDHIALVEEAFNSRPWDNSFLTGLERAKIKEMLHYQERTRRFEGVEYVIRDMKLCLSLIEIIMGERNLFHFTGELIFTDPDDDISEEFNEKGLKQIKESEDFQYHCDVNVNVKNVDRFVKNETARKWFIRHPHELYELKARYLYHKIRFEKEEEWWD